MAQVTYTSAGYDYGLFNVANQIVSKRLLRGERRLYADLTTPALEAWRKAALSATLNTPPILKVDLTSNRARMVVLAAHEADLGSMFFELNSATGQDLQGNYVDRKKLVDADGLLKGSLATTDTVFQELAVLGVPAQYRDLLLTRIRSTSYNHRVSGICGVVYLAALILTDRKL